MSLSSGSKPRGISLTADPSYWVALGHFVEAFALVEELLFATLRYYAGVSHNVSKAIFSGVRTDMSMEYIRRIIAVNNLDAERKIELDELFKHLKCISDLRNHVVHYGSFATNESGRIASNKSRALTPDKIKEFRVSAVILDGAARDLEKISSHLVLHLGSSKSSFAERARTFAVLNDAWLYTPPPNPQQKVHKSSRKGQS